MGRWLVLGSPTVGEGVIVYDQMQQKTLYTGVDRGWTVKESELKLRQLK
jgi:hypothetical protein